MQGFRRFNAVGHHSVERPSDHPENKTTRRDRPRSRSTDDDKDDPGALHTSGSLPDTVDNKRAADVPSKDDHYEQFELSRKRSLAKSLSQSFNTGKLLQKRESEATVESFHAIKGEYSLRDMYLEELDDKNIDPNGFRKTKQMKNRNIRAELNCLSLWRHDLKAWIRRLKNKNLEIPFLKHRIKHIESNFGSSIGAFFVFTRWVLMLNISLSFLWTAVVVIPNALVFKYENVTQSFSFWNLLDGKGVVGELWTFYGRYPMHLPGWEQYHISVAYFFMIIFTYFGSLLFILQSIAYAKEPKNLSTLDAQLKFSRLVFSSWDHSVTTSEASANLSKGIASMLKDNIYEAKADATVKKRTKKERNTVFAIRGIAWASTIILVGGGCTAIVLSVIASMETENSRMEESEGSFITTYGTPFLFIAINMMVPKLIELLPKIEKYASGKTEMKLTLARVFILRMANLFALVASLYFTISYLKHGCVGTVIGQEFYKLVLMDTLINAILKPSFVSLQHIWGREKLEFSVPSAVLVLVYRQGLIWVGTIACPILPFVGAVATLVFFLTNFMIVNKYCKPPVKRWNQSRNTTYLMGFLLITLLFLLLPVSLLIGSTDVIQLGKTQKANKYCGPFGQYKATDSIRWFARSQTEWFRVMLQWCGSDVLLVPLFFVLVILAIYQRTVFSGEKKHRLLLHAELIQERTKNQELSKRLQNLGLDIHV